MSYVELAMSKVLLEGLDFSVMSNDEKLAAAQQFTYLAQITASIPPASPDTNEQCMRYARSFINPPTS